MLFQSNLSLLRCLFSHLPFPVAPWSIFTVYISKSTTEVFEPDVLYLSPASAHGVVVNVGLFSVLRGLQFNFKETLTAHHCSLEVDCKDVASIDLFLCIDSSGDVTDLLRVR